jgi:hypothetical protein
MKTRIKESIVKGKSSFYPQYADLSGWVCFTKTDQIMSSSPTFPQMQPIKRNISFQSIKDARTFIQEKIDSIPVVKYHDETDHEV